LFFLFFLYFRIKTEKRLLPVRDYQLRSREITPNTSYYSPDSNKFRGPTNTMNNLPEGYQAGDGENRDRGVEEDGPFVPRTLLDYATPREIYVRGPDQTSTSGR
jgi:hypothetical protein